VPFDSQYETLVRSLAAQAAVALRNARSRILVQDALTDCTTAVTSRPEEEEFQGAMPLREPLSLTLVAWTTSKRSTIGSVTEPGTRPAPRLPALVKHSRSFASSRAGRRRVRRSSW